MRFVRILATMITALSVFAVPLGVHATRDEPRSIDLSGTEALTAAFTSSGPAAPTNPYRGFVGVTDHAFWLGESDIVAEYAPLAEAGVEWVREDLLWSVLEPRDDQFDWTRADNLMSAASRTGINVLGIVDYSAPWASSDPSGAGDVHFPPTDHGEFAEFAAAITERYGANGTFWTTRPDLTHRPLKALELWNEPWGYWFWRSGPDPAAYADLALRAATAIKAAEPSMGVLIAGDLTQVRTDGQIRGWVDQVMLAQPGLDAVVDAYSVHPYPHPLPNGPYVDRPDPRWDFGRLQLIDDTMTGLGFAKPIWITEVGWSTVDGHPDQVTEAQQADFVRGAIVRAREEFDAVERIFVFTWARDNGVSGDREGHFGMRHPDGSPKPSWDAVVELLGSEGQVLTSATSIERGGVGLAPQYRLTDGELRVVLAWFDAKGPAVQVFIEGGLHATVQNPADGRGTYAVPPSVDTTSPTAFRICDTDSPSRCSTEVEIAG